MFNPIDIPTTSRCAVATESKDVENEPQHAMVSLHISHSAVSASGGAQLHPACLLRLPRALFEISAGPATDDRLCAKQVGMLASLASVGSVEFLCETARFLRSPVEMETLLRDIAALPPANRTKPLTYLSRRLPLLRTQDVASAFDPVYEAVCQLRPEDRLAPMRELLAYANYPTKRTMFLQDMHAMPDAHQSTLLAALCAKNIFWEPKDFYELYNAIASRFIIRGSDLRDDRLACIAYGEALETLAKQLSIAFCPVLFVPPPGRAHPAVYVFDAINALPPAYQGPPMLALILSTTPYQQTDWFPSFIERILHATARLPTAFQAELLAYIPGLPDSIASRFLRIALNAIASRATGEIKQMLLKQVIRLDVDQNIHTQENHLAVLHCMALYPNACRDAVLVQWASTLARLPDADLLGLYDAYIAAAKCLQGESRNNVLYAIAQEKFRFSPELSIRSHFEILTEMTRWEGIPDKEILWSLAMTMHAVLESDHFRSGIDQFSATLQKVPEPDLFVAYAWTLGCTALQDSARVECFMHHILRYIKSFNEQDSTTARRQLQDGIQSIPVPALKEQARQMLGDVPTSDEDASNGDR